jgi:translocation and assembly module TamB
MAGHAGRTVRRVVAGVTGVLGALAALGAAAVFVITATPWGHERVRRFTLHALRGPVHGTVHIGAVGGSLLHNVVVSDVSITDANGAPFVSARRVELNYRLADIVHKRLDFHDVLLDHPVVVLVQAQDGEWNYARIFRGSGAPSDSTKRGFGSWIAMTSVRVVDGDVTVRAPWHPDTTLTGAARDSAIRKALDPGARVPVAAVPGGYEKTVAVHTLTTNIAALRLADPEQPIKFARLTALSADLAVFRPPDAVVRDLAGTLYFTGDSLWLPQTTVVLPSSRIDGRASYVIANGDLDFQLRAGPVAVGDMRFIEPRLPTDGTVTADVTTRWRGRSQQYVARNLTARIGSARVTGRIGVTIGDSLSLHDTDLRFSGVDTRLIERLRPGLTIPRPGVAAGHAVVAGSASALALDADLTFDDRAGGESHVMAAGTIGTDGAGYRARHLALTLAPLQVALGRIAMPSLPVAGTITGRATIDGSTSDSMTAHADLEHREGDAYSHLVADGDVSFLPNPAASPTDVPKTRAIVWPSTSSHRAGALPGARTHETPAPNRFRPGHVTITATLTPIDLAVLGRFLPSAKLSGQAAGDVRISGEMRDLEVRARLGVVGAPDSAGLTVDGHVDLASPVVGYDLAATTHLLDAHSVSLVAPHTALTATASARGRGTAPEMMSAELRADIQASVFDTVRVDSAHVYATVGDGLVHVDTAHVHALASSADIAGAFGVTANARGALTYRIAADSLAAFRQFLPRDTGAVAPRPGVVAEAVARARADSARTADTTEVQRAIAGGAPPALAVDSPKSLRRDSLAGHAVATGTVTGNIKRFDVTGDLVVDSVIAWGNAARRARATYQWTGAPALTTPVAATLRLDTASIAGFALVGLDAQVTYRKPDGTVRLAVRQSPARDFAANARFRYTPSESELEYDTLTLRIDTTLWRAPHPASVSWGSTGITARNVELTGGHAGHIAVDGFLPTHAGADVGIHAVVQNVELADLAALAQQDLPIQGLLAVHADVVGDTRHPRLRGNLSVSSGTINELPLPNVYLSYQYDSAMLRARAELAPKGSPSTPFAVATADLPIDLALGVTGPRLPDRPMRADVRLDSLPLDLIPQFTPAVRDVGGRLTGQVSVAGTVRKPEPRGTLTLDRGSTTIVSSGTVLRDMTARIRMTRDSVVIDTLIATTPSTGGHLQIAGSLDLTDPDVPVLNVTASARNARVLSTRERGRIDTDADMTVAGPTNAPYISGSTVIRNAVIYIPESNGKRLVDVGDAAVYYIADTSKSDVRKLIPTKNFLLSSARMDVDVTVHRDSWVRTRDANVETYTPRPITVHIDRVQQAVVVDGTLSTDRGEYAVLGKRFVINKGEAVFIGTPELNPTLQAQGEYDVPVPGREAIAIQINIGGALDSLRLTLASDAQPPISQSDLLSYLAFSVPTSGLTQQSQSSSLSSAGGGGGVVGAAGTFVQNQLAGEAVGVATDQVKGDLARALGADVLTITTANNYTDIAQSRSGAAFFQNTQVEFGKYFTPQTFVAIQASVAPGAVVVHRLGQHLSLQLSGQPLYLLGQPTLSTTQSTPLTGVFGLLLTRTWRF